MYEKSPLGAPAIIPRIKRAIIGPVDAMAITPKLSFLLFEPLRAHMPTVRDNKNGTVIAPVVAPPASRDKPKYSGGQKNARTITLLYKPSITHLSGMFLRILKRPKQVSSAQPMLIIAIRSIEEIKGFMLVI